MRRHILLMVAAILGVIIVAGCGRRPPEVPDDLEGRITRYLPVTINDEFMIARGFHIPSERSAFNESALAAIYDEPALAVIYQVLGELTPFEGALPWVVDRTRFIYGGGVILIVTNENHTVDIAFTLQRDSGQHGSERNFVRALVDSMPERWFTIETDSRLQIFELLR